MTADCQTSDKQSAPRNNRAPVAIQATGSPASASTAVIASPDNPLPLACGRSLGHAELAYETFGSLNATKTNAVLVCHALTGDSHAASSSASDKPGWWETLIGPGKPIDTERFFVIASNILGGCSGSTGPLSIEPETEKRWGPNFPIVTIGDIVDAQLRLLDHLGIDQPVITMGGSIGGFQSLEWALRHPSRVRAALVIAAGANLRAEGLAFNSVGRHAILTDPGFNGGWYDPDEQPEAGLALARKIAHLTYRAHPSLETRFGRTRRREGPLEYTLSDEFNIETYLAHQGDKFVSRFDANSYLRALRAMDYYDAAAGRESIQNAFARAEAAFYFASFNTDWLFRPAQSEELQAAARAAGRTAVHETFETDDGHDAFLLPHDGLTQSVRRFVDGLSE